MSTYLGLRTLGYKVPDLQEAKEWYTKVLDITPYFDEPFYVGFNVGGYELGLQPLEGSTPVYGNSSTTYWGVEDVRKEYDRLIELGATSFEEPGDVGGDIVVATVKDPWGNLFGIIYNPHFKL
ncbi:MAG: VOC family protein [Sphingobacteriales bacterium]|nr:MAG: VOC family protein [Sphingobacteriales bacterium]